MDEVLDRLPRSRHERAGMSRRIGSSETIGGKSTFNGGCWASDWAAETLVEEGGSARRSWAREGFGRDDAFFPFDPPVRPILASFSR